MNKNDKMLISILLIISIIVLLVFSKNNLKYDKAYVYYENKLILTIDLNINKEYIVKGYNGDVVLRVHDNDISVVEETSQKNLCSKENTIANTKDLIVCLPNKIVVKKNVESIENLDGVVK